MHSMKSPEVTFALDHEVPSCGWEAGAGQPLGGDVAEAMFAAHMHHQSDGGLSTLCRAPESFEQTSKASIIKWSVILTELSMPTDVSCS